MNAPPKYRSTAATLTVVFNEVLTWGLFGVFLFLVRPEMEKFQFGAPDRAWYFLAIPVMVAGFFAVMIWRRSALKRFGDYGLVARLIPNLSAMNPAIKFVLFRNAVFFVVIALMMPQSGSELVEGKRKGVDLMIAVDLSNSMKAEDLQPNRLERAKRSIHQLIDQLKQDRLGIVVFAGQPFVQLPITTDYRAAKIFLKTIDTDIMPTQGTAIGSAIRLAMDSFDPESPAGRAIIVISDGENHEDDALGAASEAREQGIQVHTIGMGSSEGVPIPVYVNGRKTRDFRRDKSGSPVVTKLNEQMLIDVARAGGGIYSKATSTNTGLEYIFEQITKLETGEFESKRFTNYHDHFQAFLFIALGFLLLDVLISDRQSTWIKQLNLFGTPKPTQS